MKTYCFNCMSWEEYSITEKMECMDFDHVKVFAGQKHTFCTKCGTEVFPDEVVKENVDIAHDAYRNEIGSIPVEEMKKILSMYNIGPKPLSQLLGWGENTIERQMKHSIPDKEHADRLKSLMDPFKMADLLIKYGNRVSGVALNKMTIATIKLIREMSRGNTRTEYGAATAYCKYGEQSVTTSSVSVKQETVESSSFRISYENSSRTSFSNVEPFDHPEAA